MIPNIVIYDKVFFYSLYTNTIKFFITRHALPILCMFLCTILTMLPIKLVNPIQVAVLITIVVPLSFYILLTINLIKFKPIPDLFNISYTQYKTNNTHIIYHSNNFSLSMPLNLNGDIILQNIHNKREIYYLTDILYTKVFIKSMPKFVINRFVYTSISFL